MLAGRRQQSEREFPDHAPLGIVKAVELIHDYGADVGKIEGRRVQQADDDKNAANVAAHVRRLTIVPNACCVLRMDGTSFLCGEFCYPASNTHRRASDVTYSPTRCVGLRYGLRSMPLMVDRMPALIASRGLRPRRRSRSVASRNAPKSPLLAPRASDVSTEVTTSSTV